MANKKDLSWVTTFSATQKESTQHTTKMKDDYLNRNEILTMNAIPCPPVIGEDPSIRFLR